MPRIVSLLPSATEIVCALGAADELVGISHECDFPATIRDRPVLTEARLVTGTSRAIDAELRTLVRDALAIYTVDAARLAAVAPDVVVTQDLCEVCAVTLDDVQAAVARLAAREEVQIVSLHPTRLGDVLDDVERVAAAIGRVEEGRRLRRALAERLRAIAERAARATTRPRVVTVEWLDPLMLGGTWMPELIALAGGAPVGPAAGDRAPTVDADGLRALRPAVVLVKPCGFGLDRTLAEATLVERAILDVVEPSTRVYASDGNAFFNRPGPRLVESVEIAAACIHPERFSEEARAHANVICRLR